MTTQPAGMTPAGVTPDEIRRRLYNVVPACSFQMHTLLSLFAIRFSETDTATACVTCSARPELILNPAFIAAHCRTDEHLFMLVMHELYHIILGHTTLFPRNTPARNIAFDAVINAMLCREFPGAEYTSFFTEFYSASQMPEALLRPPEGTPAQPVIDLLYSGDRGTYYEVFNAVAETVQPVAVILIGGHGGASAPGAGGAEVIDDSAACANPLVREIVEEIVARWPRPPFTISGRDAGGEVKDATFDKTAVNPARAAKIRRLLRLAGVAPSRREGTRRVALPRAVAAEMFIPDFRDRTIAARTMLQGNSLVYHSSLVAPEIRREIRRPAHVYLDVSGSVEEYLADVAACLTRPFQRGDCEIFAFSTVVEKVTPADIVNRRFKTTGGTDIDCVLRHLADMPRRKRPRRVVLITDGYTGKPDDALAARLLAEGARFHCGLFGQPSRHYLIGIVKEFVEI